MQCRAEYLKLLVSQTGVDVTSRMKQNHFSGGKRKHCDCSGFFDCLVNECDDAEKLIQQIRNMPLMKEFQCFPDSGSRFAEVSTRIFDLK